MDAKEVAILITEVLELALNRQAESLNETIQKLRGLLALERRTWCSSSEDRMYCEDGNWYFRTNEGQPCLASPPESVIRMATELISISKKRKISQHALKDAKTVADYLHKLKG